MSDTRKRALAYLQKVIGNISEKLVSASKFYEPKESFTTRKAWWFDLPISKIELNANDNYYLVGESGNDKFVVLRIPNKYLPDNRDKFDTKSGNVIRLHLAAYPENWLVDERVENGMNFSQFEIK